MGCSASANVSNTTVPRQLQVITESGKTFMMIFDRYQRVSQIKHHMEMCIASKSDQLHLYLKIEQNDATGASTLGSNSKITKEIEAKSTIVQEGDKTYKQIELEDDMFLMQYAKLIQKNPRIFLTQDKSQNTSNESVSTSVNSNGQRNQTIHLGATFNKQEDPIYLVIEKLENGEQITQSQIDILQKGKNSLNKQESQPQPASPSKENNLNSNQDQLQIQNSQSSLPQITIEAI